MGWRDTPLYRSMISGEPRRAILYETPLVRWIAAIVTGALLLGSWLLGGWYGFGALMVAVVLAHVILRIKQGHWEL